MERIKQFYEEHKTGVLLTSLVAVTALTIHARQIKGHKIDTVNYVHDDQGDPHILVWKKNGEIRSFSRRQAA